MFSRFERLIPPYPEQAPQRLPRGLLPFVWACTQGLRGYVAVIIVLVAAVGMFEAFLFGMLGHVVDWLGSLPPQRLWLDEGGTLLLLAGALVASIGGRHGLVPGQVPGHLVELSDAAAVEFPPPDARPEHGLLSGRVRRPHLDQGDADRAGGARHGDDRLRHPGVRGHLLRHHGAAGRWLRCTAAAAVSRLAGVVRVGPALVRAAAGPRRAAAGRCALADDRAHHRRLHQHRHREAVFACAARGGVRARRDAGVHGHRLHAVPPGHRRRSGQPRAEHGPDPRHHRAHAVVVDAGARRRRRGGGGHRDGAAPERHLALDHVGDGDAVRARGHGAGRHEHVLQAAGGGRPRGCQAARGVARRHPLRAGAVCLWQRGRGDRQPRSAHPARREDRPGRPLGCRQIHRRQPAAALLRPAATAAS